MKVCRWLRWPLLLSLGITGNHTRIPWPPQNSHNDSFRWFRCDSLNQIHSTQEAKHVEVWKGWRMFINEAINEINSSIQFSFFLKRGAIICLRLSAEKSFLCWLSTPSAGFVWHPFNKWKRNLKPHSSNLFLSLYSHLIKCMYVCSLSPSLLTLGKIPNLLEAKS